MPIRDGVFLSGCWLKCLRYSTSSYANRLFAGSDVQGEVVGMDRQIGQRLHNRLVS